MCFGAAAGNCLQGQVLSLLADPGCGGPNAVSRLLLRPLSPGGRRQGDKNGTGDPVARARIVSMFLMCAVIFYHENPIACSCVLALTGQSFLGTGRFQVWTPRAATSLFSRLQVIATVHKQSVDKGNEGRQQESLRRDRSKLFFSLNVLCPPPPTPTGDSKAIWAPLPANSSEYT